MFNMTKQYGGYLNKTDIHEIDELQRGQGAILSKGLKKVAVYKDRQNNVHAFSAVCPHMGCMVQWNADEGSFRLSLSWLEIYKGRKCNKWAGYHWPGKIANKAARPTGTIDVIDYFRLQNVPGRSKSVFSREAIA